MVSIRIMSYDHLRLYAATKQKKVTKFVLRYEFWNSWPKSRMRYDVSEVKYLMFENFAGANQSGCNFTGDQCLRYIICSKLRSQLLMYIAVCTKIFSTIQK